MLLYTKSVTEHRVLASTQRGITNPREKGSATAIGEMLDKCARVILPPSAIPSNADAVVYAKLMHGYCQSQEKYRDLMRHDYEAPRKRQDEIEYYQSENGTWALPPPLRQSRDMIYDFTGLGGKVRAIMDERSDMKTDERQELGYHTMRLAFEHVMSRVILALQNDEELLANPPQALVISGGVASNMFFRKVAASMLQARGFGDIDVTAPRPAWCTDNAAMIAWTGYKMYQAGWTTDNAFLPQGEWPIEEILTGVDCWVENSDAASLKPTENVAAPPQDTSQVPDNLQPQEPILSSTSNAPAKSDASVKPNLDKTNRCEANEKSFSLEEKLQRIQRKLEQITTAKAEYDDGKPSVEHGPCRPSLQGELHAPNSEEPDSLPRGTPGPPSTQARKRPAQSEDSSTQLARRTSSPSGLQRRRRGREHTSSVRDLIEKERELLRPISRRAADPFRRPETGTGPRSPSRAGVDRVWTPRHRLERAGESRAKVGPFASGPTKVSTDEVIHQAAEVRKRNEKQKGKEEKGEKRLERLRPTADDTSVEPEKKRTVVRLLPRAENPVPEGPLRTGLNSLKRWVGL
ncbi:glycoprotease pgp1 [Diaporthe amygdali]|uniref:glycoprotease pgp1 n=1 Tax=Phomopsis amygdali TaxID=1214568 RepID=UPI0022FE3BBB|nr:glycoprotease pgp1 [Diaporthe amygdali]KAJ0121132.1 glycoprotease pgp1 [Diaporthe amygdali]